MKNLFKWLGIIAFAAVIVFSFATCDDDSGGGGGFNGIWKTSDGEEITLNNGSFTISKDNKQFLKGKYTTSARSVAANITMEIKEIHGDFLSETDKSKTFENKWYDEKKVKETYSSLSDSQIAALLEILFKTETGTIDGDTMTIAGDTYAKQGGGSGGGGGGGGGGKWTLVDVSGIFGSRNGIRVIVYGNGKFVAGHVNGRMATSPDGITWTAVADSKLESIRAIAYGGDKFVAGGDGKMAYSSDGINWTAVADSKFSTRNDIRAIAYGGGKFVAGGWNGMAYSTDGVNWTAVTDSTFSRQYIIEAIAWGNGTFVANKMAYSSDGVNWTAITGDEGVGDLSAITYGNNRFVAVGTGYISNPNIKNTAYSFDGTTWKSVNNNTISEGSTIKAIAWGNNKFVVGDGNRGNAATSPDGITWTAAGEYILGGWVGISAIAYGSGRFVAVGSDCKLAYSTGL